MIEFLSEKLERHPKRIVYCDGLDDRVIKAAGEFVDRKLGVAILLGEEEAILGRLNEFKMPLKHIRVLDPKKSSDLPQFIQIVREMPRYKGISEEAAEKIVISPTYFGSLMVQNGYGDCLVGGVQSTSGNLLRSVFQVIDSPSEMKSVFGCVLIDLNEKNEGEDGILFLADSVVIPNPSVKQLTWIATETAKMARQITEKKLRIAMLSYSTKGSAATEDAEKVVAATALARQYFMENDLPFEIDGELQVDAALDPHVAKIKAPGSPVEGRANVLIFPGLNSGNIGVKLIQKFANTTGYGNILLGLKRPVADISRGASVKAILGVSIVLGLQAISYRSLYSEGQRRYAKEE